LYGLILRTCGFWGNVVGFAYSPTTPGVVFNEGLEILGEVMNLRISFGGSGLSFRE
jgi:hypothetical protein